MVDGLHTSQEEAIILKKIFKFVGTKISWGGF